MRATMLCIGFTLMNNGLVLAVMKLGREPLETGKLTVHLGRGIDMCGYAAEQCINSNSKSRCYIVLKPPLTYIRSVPFQNALINQLQIVTAFRYSGLSGRTMIRNEFLSARRRHRLFLCLVESQDKSNPPGALRGSSFVPLRQAYF